MFRLAKVHKFFSATRSRLFSENKISISDIDPRLRSDIKNIGNLLGLQIKKHDPSIFEAVENLRKLSRDWRMPDGDPKLLSKMISEVETCPAEKLLLISRSFASFLALANSAENHHRIRVLKEIILSSGTPYGLWLKEASTSESIAMLLKQGKSPENIFKALTSQQIEIVLTAHPTEVNRRTMLQKHRKIKEILEQLDNQNLSVFERKKLNSAMSAEIASIWDSDNLRRSKPSPIDEAKVGLAILENVLWNAVPKFMAKLDDVVKTELGQALPLNIAPIRIASWMGGDRDGNPNVTPAITIEASLLSRWLAATLFKKDINNLKATLSLRTCSEELRIASNNAREPYREVLKKLESRLQATLDLVNSKLTDSPLKVTVEPLLKNSELLDPLLMLHRSIMEIGLPEIANGPLADTIRRASIFGLNLMQLDIRQESARHTEALDAITKYLGIGSYSQWDETTRCSWLQAELSSKRPLLHRNCCLETLKFLPTVVDTLKTFQVIAGLGEGTIGGYVISHCEQASDVLAVMLLQQDAGVTPALKVVPLFETLDDLQRASDTIDSLFSMAIYRGRIRNKQQIMVGYSDSAKDAGLIAACWAQYNSQVAMVEVANRHGIELTFFHGKGGTVGRGGNPALYQAILAHPPGTINGRFRITEQGEMITQNYGQEAVAERTLDLFSAGVLTERFLDRPVVKEEWKKMMEKLSDVSCKVYRHLLQEDTRFVPYFRSATPELELAGLNVGSRPAKRNPKGGIDSLRAIPWVFAWTQTRLNLPTWLGAGEALRQELEKNPEIVKDMYKNWPWFTTLIDLLEMILAKSDVKIAENYDIQLVKDSDALELGKELRGKLADASKTILAITGNPYLQAGNKMLLSSLAVRNPYLDPLNIIQAELLKRLRTVNNLSEEESSALQDALLITINGIANGMRNSG